MRHPRKQPRKRAALKREIENIQMICFFFIIIHIHGKQSVIKPVSNNINQKQPKLINSMRSQFVLYPLASEPGVTFDN